MKTELTAHADMTAHGRSRHALGALGLVTLQITVRGLHVLHRTNRDLALRIRLLVMAQERATRETALETMQARRLPLNAGLFPQRRMQE